MRIVVLLVTIILLSFSIPAYAQSSAGWRPPNSGLEVGRGGGEAADAHNRLCDLNWWRGSASGPAVEELLRIPGVDPNTVCNLSNDRPIHLPLKLTSFIQLTENVNSGIRALVDGGADLLVRNDSNRSALGLVEVRYDRVKDRMGRDQSRWCRDEITINQFVSEVNQHHRYEYNLYQVLSAKATGVDLQQVVERSYQELYGASSPNQTKDQICAYRGVRRVR